MTGRFGSIEGEGHAETGGEDSPGRHAWLEALVGIFASPRRSFDVVRRSSPWLAPFLVLAAGTAALASASAPLNNHATRAQLTAMNPDNPEQVDLMMAQLEQPADAIRWVTMAAGPLVLAFGLVVKTVLVWLLAIALQGRLRFAQALSLTVHLALVLHVKDWTNFLLVHLRGVEAIRSPLDLQAQMGLDLLLAGENAALNVFYASVNPFTIWFVALLAVGAAQVLELPRRNGWLLAAIYWAATTAFAAASVATASRLLPA